MRVLSPLRSTLMDSFKDSLRFLDLQILPSQGLTSACTLMSFLSKGFVAKARPRNFCNFSVVLRFLHSIAVMAAGLERRNISKSKANRFMILHGITVDLFCKVHHRVGGLVKKNQDPSFYF